MKKSLPLLLTAVLLPSTLTEACSRAVYFGQEGQTVTGRTMDWFVSDMDTNLWLYPRGLERTSGTKTPDLGIWVPGTSVIPNFLLCRAKSSLITTS